MMCFVQCTDIPFLFYYIANRIKLIYPAFCRVIKFFRFENLFNKAYLFDIMHCRLVKRIVAVEGDIFTPFGVG